MSETIETGHEIARTNRLFTELRRIGEVDAKGRVRFARGFKGKQIAKPDHPLMHFAAMIEKLVLEGFGYSSEEACKKDVEMFVAWANSLKPEAPLTAGDSHETKR